MDEPIIEQPTVEPPAPGRQIDVTIQAATDQALTVLLMQHGLLVAGEGGVRPAPGVLHSHIGSAEVDGVKLAGRYALIRLDEGVIGEAETASLLLALDPHRYTGPDLRIFLGGSGYRDDGVPFAVTMRQARQALLLSGTLGATAEAVDAAVKARIGALSEPVRSLALIEWEYSTEVQRNRPLVTTLGQALGMTAAQLDALFVQARSL